MTEYTGYIEKTFTGEELESIYDTADAEKCPVELLENQYLITHDENGKSAGIYRRKGNVLYKVARRKIKRKDEQPIWPKNDQQTLAVNLLYDEDITVKLISGKFGSGKTFLMTAAALDITSKSDRRIVYIRNNIEVRDSNPLGFLPGDMTEKLLPYAMPFADHVGGQQNLMKLINSGTLEIAHLGFIRGRDLRNCIIICSEAENMTKEHVQLLMGRVGENAEIWFDGDIAQIDKDVFVRNNGMQAMIDKLRGHQRFGYVQLKKSERSETAEMAELLD